MQQTNGIQGREEKVGSREGKSKLKLDIAVEKPVSLISRIVSGGCLVAHEPVPESKRRAWFESTKCCDECLVVCAGDFHAHQPLLLLSGCVELCPAKMLILELQEYFKEVFQECEFSILLCTESTVRSLSL